MKVPEYILRNRHNKTARGMTATAYRSGHSYNGQAKADRVALSVTGTTDKLRSGLRLVIRPKGCPCCGAKTGKLELNEYGRRRLLLARLRARAAHSKHATKMVLR